jgi:response regulator RpfG family c-di-GMP phosphodiesterase
MKMTYEHRLQYEHTLLMVDDEPSILKSLKRALRKEGYTLLTAEGGQQALDMLAQVEKPVSLIISDQRMPSMNGATFLELSREIAPDAIRFLLTGYSDMDAVVDAVNKGKIHKYLTKPWNDPDLIMHVRAAVGQQELKLENQRLTELTQRQNEALADLNKGLEERVAERTWALKVQNKKLQQLNSGLEKSLMDSIRLLLSLVESSNPKLGSYMKATGKLARQIAETAGLDTRLQNQVEMAGLVHDIGLLGMPDSLLGKDELSMSGNEFDAYTQHPGIAAISLSSVAELKEVTKIVAAHHEKVDGSGFPNKIKARQIPLGAKILAVAADYCTMVHLWPKVVRRMMGVARKYSSQDALDMVELADEPVVREKIAQNVIMEGAGKRYDAAIVGHFMKSIGGDPTINTIKHLEVNQLRPGVVLVEDLRLKDGRLLITRGTALDDGALKVIQEVGGRKLIEGTIPIMMSASPPVDLEECP